MKSKVKYKGKLKAFTLVEVTVTLLLSLIVVGMMYMALRIVANQVRQLQDKEYETITLLKGTLDRAFFDATVIEFLDRERLITCEDSLHVKKILLEEQAVCLFRGEELLDTLYKGEYEFEISESQDKLVRDASFSFLLKSDTVLFRLHKNYEPATIINRKQLSFEY